MALAAFSKKAVTSLGLRSGAPALLLGAQSPLRALALRGYSTVVDGLLYTESHEWVKVEGDTAILGITDYAQEQLGEIIHAELPSVRKTVTAGESLIVVESVKIAADVYCPVGGKVMEINRALSQDPSVLNDDPYGKGWMVKVKMSNPDQVKSLKLMDSQAYSRITA